MTEDELLLGITQALELSGWRWTHIRRSDGVTVGASGLPDIIAAHPSRNIALAWELKTERGVLTPDQAAWQIVLADRRIDARIVRPSDYDEALRDIFGGAWPSRPLRFGLAPGELEPR